MRKTLAPAALNATSRILKKRLRSNIFQNNCAEKSEFVSDFRRLSIKYTPLWFLRPRFGLKRYLITALLLLACCGELLAESSPVEEFQVFAGAGGGIYQSGVEDRLYGDRLDGLLIHAPTGLHEDHIANAASFRVAIQYRKGPWLVTLDGQTMRSVSHHEGLIGQSPVFEAVSEAVQARHSRWNTQLVGGYNPFFDSSHLTTASLFLLVGYDLTGAYTRLDRARISQAITGLSSDDRIDVLHTGRLVGLEYRFEGSRIGIQARYLYQYSPYGRWESERKTFYANGQMEFYSELGPVRTDGHRIGIGFDYALSRAWLLRFHYMAGITNIYDQGVRAAWTGTSVFHLERFILNRLLAERTSIYKEEFQIFEMGIVWRVEVK